MIAYFVDDSTQNHLLVSVTVQYVSHTPPFEQVLSLICREKLAKLVVVIATVIMGTKVGVIRFLLFQL